MNISKELFSECIRSLRRVNDFQNGVCGLIHDINKKHEDREMCDMGAMLYPDCSQALVDLLTTITNDTKGLISWFCYEADFGRNNKTIEKDDPKTINELWNMIIAKE